jgi:lysozyme
VINESGKDLLKFFERGKDPVTGKLLPKGVPALVAYNDRPDETGVWTISWGITGPDVKRGTVWSVDKCEARFAEVVRSFTEQVLAECKVEPNENQLAAMVCLAYNIGMGWKGKKGPRDRDGFRQSTVLRLHNSMNFTGAAKAFGMWNKDGGEVRAGLTRRRAAEAALYLSPVNEEESPQSIRVAPSSPEPKAIDPVKIAAGVGGAATVLNSTVASVSEAWDTISKAVDPRFIVWGLAVVAVGSLCYFIWEQVQRRKEGDR